VAPVEDAGTRVEQDTTTPSPIGSLITTAANDDGSQLTSVDASNSEVWVYFDIDTGLEVTNSDGWDLAFKRSNIMVNGGVSGSGGVTVSILPGVEFGELSQAPASGYRTDEENPDDANNPDLVFAADGGWYDYDVSTHTLTARDQVYVVATTDGAWFKLKMDTYYRGEEGGYPTFNWASVEAPADSPSFPVDASAGWAYVNLDANVVVEPTDPATDTNWDIAFNEAQIQTNGGTSGSAFGGAQLFTGTWEELISSDSVGYSVDTSLPIPGPPGAGDFSGSPAFADWYDYDFETHTLSPKEVVFMVRASDGDYFKLRILGYDSGVYTVEAEPVTRELQTHETVFPADEWSDLNFASGELAESSEASWDIGINGVQCRTNGGTSGDGQAGALVSEAASLDDVSEIPRSGCYFLAKGHICECDITAQECTEQQGAWTPQCACDVEPTADSMLPIPGPPGAGEYSGNSVLGSWYDYDPVTHVVSPKAAVFIVRDASGSWAKVQFTDYTDGAVTASWVWAGPGRFDF